MPAIEPFGPDDDGREYGRELAQAGTLGIGGCMDAALAGEVLCVIGKGVLHTFDVSRPLAPRPLGRLAGLGHTRQIALDQARGLAFVSAREDGLFIIDLADPARPAVLRHYDTVEMATGVAVSGNLCLVSCRQYGVELIDATDPARPRHLSLIRTGEAQSVVARDGFAYAGVWSSRKVVICDIRNPLAPRIVAEATMDGYGDGLCVRGDYCFAATGHHAAAQKERDASDPAFGRGHGLEIFDIAHPTAPRFVSRLKLPRLYSLHHDMWDVAVSGRYAFVGDTHNGLYVIDIADVNAPRYVARHRLPVLEPGGQPVPVGGFAVGRGVVYIAGAFSDLHVIEAEGLAAPVAPEPERAPLVLPPTGAAPADDDRFLIYKPDAEGQVHAVKPAPESDVAYLACGMAGLHSVRLRAGKYERLATVATPGFAFDVAVRGDRLYAAEGLGGLAIYERLPEGRLRELGRYRPPLTVKQVVAPGGGGSHTHATVAPDSSSGDLKIVAPGGGGTAEADRRVMRFVLLHVGENGLHIVDVADPRAPRLVLEDRHLGPLYGRQITDGLLGGRYASVFWQVPGFYWYDLAAEPGPRLLEQRLPGVVGAENGMVFIGEAANARALVTYRGGYCLVGLDEARELDTLERRTLPGVSLSGKPTVCGTTLYSANRWNGTVTAVDIADVDQPRLLWRLEIAGSPEPVVEWASGVAIPAGNQGLLLYRPPLNARLPAIGQD